MQSLSEFIERTLFKALYRGYLWYVEKNRGHKVFQISERIIEYPFAIANIRELPRGSKIAVLGCHGDLLTTILPSLGYETHGFDMKPYDLEYENFHFHKIDVREIGLPDNSFDAVIAVSTVEHIGMFDGDKDGDEKALAEANRILKPGGILILTVPCARQRHEISMYQRTYDPLSLERLLPGLSIEELLFYSRNQRGMWERIDLTGAQFPSECVALLKATKIPSKA